MGSRISPLLANIWMEHFEQLALQSTQLKPRLWIRYVDDVLVIASFTDSEITEFVAHLNSLHRSMQFTCEMEVDGAIPFLDILVRKDHDRGVFATSVYRKPTHSDRYLPWNSCHSRKTRIGVLKTLVIRGIRSCNSEESLKAELAHLTAAFVRNDYPPNVIKSVINSTLERNGMGRNGIYMKMCSGGKACPRRRIVQTVVGRTRRNWIFPSFDRGRRKIG